jgi:hypothetical protein
MVAVWKLAIIKSGGGISFAKGGGKNSGGEGPAIKRNVQQVLSHLKLKLAEE